MALMLLKVMGKIHMQFFQRKLCKFLLPHWSVNGFSNGVPLFIGNSKMFVSFTFQVTNIFVVTKEFRTIVFSKFTLLVKLKRHHGEKLYLDRCTNSWQIE